MTLSDLSFTVDVAIVIFCGVASIVSTAQARFFFKSEKLLAQLTGCKYFAEALVFILMGVGSVGRLYKFSQADWLSFTIIKLLVVIFMLIASYRLFKYLKKGE